MFFIKTYGVFPRSYCIINVLMIAIRPVIICEIVVIHIISINMRV
jgi:hypothetical protein